MHYPVIGHKEDEAGNLKDPSKHINTSPRRAQSAWIGCIWQATEYARRKEGNQVKLSFETEIEM